jgi:hypothetical protein
VAWVYGGIVAGAAVVVAASVVASVPGQVLLYTAVTMAVIWLIHSYAAFVGHGGRLDLGGSAGRIRAAMLAELPLLVSATPTLIALAAACLLGAGVATAGLVGVIASITTMAIVASLAARRAGAERWGIVLSAIAALVFGAILIGAKIALK